MAKTNWIFPVRLKIVLLIAGALAASLLSYLYIGTTLTVEDKVSYIYDYNLNRIETSAGAIEAQISKILMLEKTLGNSVGTDGASASGIFLENAASLGISTLVFLDASQKTAGFFGTAVNVDATLAELGWTPEVYRRKDSLIGTLDSGSVVLGGRVRGNRNGETLYTLAVFMPELKTAEGGRNYYISLVDSLGDELASESTLKEGYERELEDSFSDLTESVIKSTFKSGARDWNAPKNTYIVGYRRLGLSELTLIGLIPRQEAFSAAAVLVKRSLVLGMSVMLLAIGLTLIFVKKLTGSLKQMWQATQKVSQGDFSARVSMKNMSRDEIGGLATSFNAMADKIDELMKQTALKATMQKELETAQAVQSGLFPQTVCDLDQVKLAGRSVAATQCGGDWWYHVRIGDHLILLLGDVTGHGVSAALLTAAAHGAFSAFVRMYRQPKGGTIRAPSLKLLIEYLNTAILEAAKGKSSMTCFVAVMDLKTGLLSYVNLSHKAPYHFRKTAPPAPINALKDFNPLMDAQAEALGLEANLKLAPETLQLLPGDMLFIYTDGLVECQNEQGATLRSTSLLKLLGTFREKEGSNSSAICDQLVGESMRFLGDNSKHLSDDITVVVLSIPESAKFQSAAPKVA